MIEWHEVTWYSRLGSFILFLGVVPVLTFYIGTQYELAVHSGDYTLPLTQSSIPITVKVASADTCELLFAGKLSRDASLPFSCGTNIGNGNAVTFMLLSSGGLKITQDSKTLLNLDPKTSHNSVTWSGTIYRANSLIFTDLNYDGYLDFGIESESSGISNLHYDFYLYNPVEKIYEATDNLPYDLSSPEFDQKAQTITSNWYDGGAGDFYHEETFHWENGKYVLVKRIARGGDVCTGLILTTEERRNGSLVTVSSKNLGPDDELCQTRN
jgi:hypothetical protein